MDLAKKDFGKKSFSQSGNMSDFYHSPWRMPSASHMHSSLTNPPAFNPSLQSNTGNSRDFNPSLFFNKKRTPYRQKYQTLPFSNQTQPFEEFVPLDPTQGLKPSIWSESCNGGNLNPCASQADISLYGLSSLSLAHTSQENLSLISCVPVELLVNNLDQNIDAKEMKKILLAWFTEVVMVLHVSVFVQSDGYLAATVTVPSQLDAQFAISQLHRKRIGTKRIVISYITHDQQPPGLKRSKVLKLLKEVPGKRLPLFKFRELYERRYQETIGVSELYNMRDIISVNDNMAGRMVSLSSDFDSLHSFMVDSFMQDPDELKYCKLHSQGPDKSVGWAERDHSAILPNVRLSLKAVSHAIHVLLESHGGSVPLASLMDCYHANVESLEEDPTGVPLEHLISCLPGVCIAAGPGGFKYVKRTEARMAQHHDPEDLSRYVSPPLVGHTVLFSRELVDLLKTFSHCRMLLTKFIPAYHHHFGRQCRVADYGYTKLADLLVSLSHLIQIMGEGSKKTLTLSHKVQVKRFSSDLLRVLKSQPSKTITLDVFPETFERVMGRTWDVTDYGVCEIMDLLREIQETTVVLKTTEEGTTIAIPRREQTAEEIERTRLFATEVVELLRHVPHCKMQFNRFVPAYHHHYGKQCKVADYGFNKLIELLEAIPHVLQILGEDEEGERMLQLVENERIRILGDQIFTLVKNSPNRLINLSALATVFMQYYGYSLKPSHYECEDVAELIEKLRTHVKIEEKESELKVTLVDKSSVNELWKKSRKLLWDEPECSLPLKKFIDDFIKKFNDSPDTKVFEEDLQEYLQVIDDGDDRVIKLVPLQAFARDLLIILNEAGGRMLLTNFESSYFNRFGVPCRPASFGFPNLTVLIQSLGEVAHIKGKKTRRIIVLNKDKVPDLPTYCPAPQTQNNSTEEKSTKPTTPFSPLPPPPLSFPQTQGGMPPPATPPCDQKIYSKDILGSHLLMGLTPPPQQTYQPPSPVIYSGSPVTPNGSVVWGQVWSPQYSMMPQLSPAHYMVPTIPINWGNVPSSPLPTQLKSDKRNGCKIKAPVTIQTLELLGEDLPPNPCTLPSPEMFTNNRDRVESDMKTPDEDEIDSPKASFSPQLSKNSAKKRLAVHFDTSQ